MNIIPSDEVIGISICTKNFGEVFEIENMYQRLTCNTKEKFGGSILKSLSFGTWSSDFAESFF